ncbi:hypothetical protein EG329_005506 [Mollisiaceae sp. DMI_Dod_QoI]|nr:hypothetical protein EG329_005506 [Helotiales sp. DMI_Dod_QoI]
MATTSLGRVCRPHQLQELQGWYGSGAVSDTILEDVFAEAKQIFEDALCENEYDKTWITSRASIKDVIQAVQDAQDTYHAKLNSKAWKWLALFSSRVQYYSPILDAMAQNLPAYASLAWGAMRVLFVSVANHEESVHQLVKALCRFTDYLPRHELKLILYPSIQMQQAVAKVYARLIHFMVHALKWYQKCKAKRAIGSIFKPFALDFQDELTEVNELSRAVDEIANTAAQAELRAVHARVEDVNNELSLARLEIKSLSDLVSLQADRVFQVASCTQSLSSHIQLDLHAQAAMIRTVQLNQIISAPFMNDIPSSGASLKYCSTFTQRQPQAIILSQSEIELLRYCSTDNDISYMIMENYSQSDGKALLLSLLQQVQTAHRPVIWALRFVDYLNRSLCLEDITYYEENLLASHSASAISWIFTLQLFFMWAGGAVFGRVIDTYGTHHVAIPCGIGCTFFIFMVSLCTEYYQILLAQGVGFGISAAGLFSCATTSVGQSFEKRKALALGIALSGSSTGGFVHPLYLQHLINEVGFKQAIRWASLVIGVSSTLACVFMRSRLPRKKWDKHLNFIDFSLFKQSIFSVYCIGTFFVTWGLFAPWNYLPSMSLRHGFSHSSAIYTIVVLNAASVIGRILPAYIADKFGRFNLVSIISILNAICLLAFWLPLELNTATTHTQIFAFGAVYGFTSGAFIGVMMSCVAELGRVENLGQRFGTYQFVVGVGSLTSLPIQGALIPEDNYGFAHLILFSGICMVVGTGFLCVARMLRSGGGWRV